MESVNTGQNFTTPSFQEGFEDGETPRSLSAKGLQTSALLVVCISAAASNGIVVVVLVRSFSLKNVPNILLFCLTAVNLLIAVVNMPFAIISIAADEWLFGQAWCELSAFMNQFLTFTSNVMVTVVAMYRYQAIANTFSAQITLRGAKWITGFALFYALVFSIPPFFGWNSYQFSRSKGFCTLRWQDGGSSMAYSLLVVLACFLVPFVMIIFMYVRIGVISRNNTKNTRTEPSSFSSPSSSVRMRGSGSDDVSHDVGRDVTRRYRATRMQRLSKRYLASSKDSISDSKTITSVLYVMMTYVLFLSPYYVMNIAWALSQDSLSPAMDFTVAWLHYCHATAVAIVYGYLNRRIRACLRQLPWRPGCPGGSGERGQPFVDTPYVVEKRR